MKKSIISVGLGASLASAALAQDITFAAQMQAINAAVPIPDTRAVEADALAAVQTIATQQALCVPTGIHMEKLVPATADRRAILDIDAGKLKNMWLAYGKPTGCPSPSKIRFIVLLMPDQTIRARIVNRGESIASPSLMRDTSIGAAVIAWTAIKAVDPTCAGRDMAMAGTKIGAKSADLSPDFYSARYHGSWQEVWTFSVCGRRAAVPISFKADGTGGAYTSVDKNAVTLIAP